MQKTANAKNTHPAILALRIMWDVLSGTSYNSGFILGGKKNV